MAYKYPFITGEDLKAAASQLNLNFDIENIQSSMALAADDLKDVISDEVWNKMITYFNHEAYNPEGTEVDDKLVQAFLAPMANLTLHHHFIWLQLNISSSGITVIKGDNETAAYKYQTDEAKDKLLQTAWVETNNLIDFLNTNATAWTNWTASTLYTVNQIVRDNSIFYKCNTEHTSGETFEATNWDVEADADVILHEWTLSDQKTELEKLIFTDYKDFDKYFGIDKNAAFYIRLRYIIMELIAEHIKPRITDPYTITDEVLLLKVKRVLAYESMATAIYRFDILNLPFTIRQSITNSLTKKGDDQNQIKQGLSEQLANKATDYLKQLDIYQAGKTEVTDDVNPYEDYEKDFDSDDKYVSMI